MTPICPCCGGQVIGRKTPNEVVRLVDFTPSEQRVFDFTARHFGRPVLNDHLIDYVYSDDPDGGPEGAADCINMFRHRVRHKIQPFGLTVRGRGSGVYGGGKTMMTWLP